MEDSVPTVYPVDEALEKLRATDPELAARLESEKKKVEAERAALSDFADELNGEPRYVFPLGETENPSVGSNVNVRTRFGTRLNGRVVRQLGEHARLVSAHGYRLVVFPESYLLRLDSYDDSTPREKPSAD